MYLDYKITVKQVLDGCMVLVQTNQGLKINYLYGKEAEKMIESSKENKEKTWNN